MVLLNKVLQSPYRLLKRKVSVNKIEIQKIKFIYYIKNTCKLLIPRKFYRWRLKYELNKLNDYEKEYLAYRTNYYNKLNTSFKISTKAVTSSELWSRQKRILFNYFIKKNKTEKKLTTYFFDLYNIFSFFSIDKMLDYKFGDVRDTFSSPIIVKSRPILNNENSIIMKLESVRHFNYVKDKKQFIDKKEAAVWRGNASNNKKRLFFVENYHHIKKFDIGQHGPVVNKPWFKGYMSIYDQLKYKFIFCIEGKDTATSMKWIMSSNSICVMPRPAMDTWFMEGSLKGDVHYVEVQDDFSDAEEKIDYYNNNIGLSLKIIEKAHTHVKQFNDPKREKLISLLVLDKYFSLSGQTQMS